MQLNFQDAASSSAENLMLFHDSIMTMIMIMLCLISWLMFAVVSNKFYDKFLIDGMWIEIIWTWVPAMILIFMGVPSLKLLYSMDETVFAPLTMKVSGHQWYWTYEYPEYCGDLEFDSYMIPTEELEEGNLSLLEVDNKMVLPVNLNMRFLVTGADVMHSFAVPSLGIKIDAIPGSINQGFMFCKSIGCYYGQCSEICGADHSFMPIVIETVTVQDFFNKIQSFGS